MSVVKRYSKNAEETEDRATHTHTHKIELQGHGGYNCTVISTCVWVCAGFTLGPFFSDTCSPSALSFRMGQCEPAGKSKNQQVDRIAGATDMLVPYLTDWEGKLAFFLSGFFSLKSLHGCHNKAKGENFSLVWGLKNLCFILFKRMDISWWLDRIVK